MKHILILIISFFLSTILIAQEKKEVIKLSEPTKVTENFELYGALVDEYDSPESLNEVLSEFEETSSVVIKTNITEVCEKKGCFFIAQDGESSARITFKDYGFFIPTDSEGKEVTIIGELTKTVLSEERAKHFAEDAGKSTDNIKGEQVEYSIVASTVIIQKESKK